MREREREREATRIPQGRLDTIHIFPHFFGSAMGFAFRASGSFVRNRRSPPRPHPTALPRSPSTFLPFFFPFILFSWLSCLLACGLPPKYVSYFPADCPRSSRTPSTRPGPCLSVVHPRSPRRMGWDPHAAFLRGCCLERRLETRDETTDEGGRAQHGIARRGITRGPCDASAGEE